MEGLKPGRIVYFVFDGQGADEVNRRRTTGASIADRITASAWPVGAQAHIGSPVRHGDVLPAMVVRVHDHHSVNLRVMLDGTDVYWATSVAFDPAKRPRSWHWMFEGQSTRYDATTPQ